MSIPPAPALGSNIAGDLVASGWETWSAKADTAFGEAVKFIGDLREFEVEDPVTWSSDFNVPDHILDPFSAPEKPKAPQIDFSYPLIPEPLDIEVPRIPDIGDVPEFNKNAPPLSYGSKPDALNIDPPGPAPELAEILVPDSPDYEFPEVPSLMELQIPDPPDIVEHEFEGVRPEFNELAPEATIDFVEEPYSSELLDKTTDKIKEIIDDGTGLPAYVEQALFDRARNREEVNAKRSIQEAQEEFAAKGFSLPPGVLARRISEAHRERQDKQSQVNREVMIQQFQAELEQLRFAISSAISLEGQLLNAHMQIMQRKFEFVRAAVEVALAVFEAKLQKYNTEVTAFRADAEVFRALIQAELTKVERFRAQIEGERVRGEINQQRVDIYRSQIEAVQSLINVYTAEIQAARAKADINESKIRAFAAEVDAYRSQVQAKGDEFAAWATEIQGETAKLTGYEAETRAFLARVQAYDTGVRAKLAKPEVELRAQESRVNQYRSQLEHVRERIRAETAKGEVASRLFAGEANIYASAGQIAANQADSSTRQFTALVQEQQAKSEQANREAQLKITQVIERSNQILESTKAGAQVAGQLSAAALSAVSLSAGMSDNFGTSIGKSWNYGISQSIDDDS